MSTNPITAPSVTQPVIPTSNSSSSSSSQTADVAGALTSTDTFLQLLVAQLKNQDPLNPADGTAFVTQLATFSGVEQSTEMRNDLDAIKTAVTTPVAATAPSSSSSSSSTDSTSTDNSTTNSTNNTTNS